MVGGQRTDVRNWRTIAVFLGPRQTMAEERLVRRKARDIACIEPTFVSSSVTWLLVWGVEGAIPVLLGVPFVLSSAAGGEETVDGGRAGRV